MKNKLTLRTTRPAAAPSLGLPLRPGPAGRRRTDGLPDLLLLPRSAEDAVRLGESMMSRRWRCEKFGRPIWPVDTGSPALPRSRLRRDAKQGAGHKFFGLAHQSSPAGTPAVSAPTPYILFSFIVAAITQLFESPYCRERCRGVAGGQARGRPLHL